MLRSLSSCCDERKVDVCCGCGAQLFLCLLSRLFQTLHCHLVAGKVNTLCLLELVDHPVCDRVIEVITAEVSITVGCQNLDDTVTDLDDGDIEGTAAEIVYHDLLLGLIVQTVSKRCSGRLVDDSLDIKSCDLTGVLGCLSLCIVEVSRNGDNRLGYLLAEICLCVCLQLLKDHRGDLLRSVCLVVNAYFIVASHVSLDGSNGSVCVGYRLTLCRLADQSLTGLGKCNNRRGCADTLCICDNGRLSAFHNCYTAVCCTKINTNDFSHDVSPFYDVRRGYSPSPECGFPNGFIFPVFSGLSRFPKGLFLYLYHGMSDYLSPEGVTLLKVHGNRIFLGIALLIGHNRVMKVRIELLSQRLDRLHIQIFE